MRSILTVNTAATGSLLTTRERVKLELKITDKKSDDILDLKIAEASSDIEAALGYRVPREQVTETFWHEEHYDAVERFVLERYPIVSIDSVTVDDEAIDPSLYRLDPTLGLLYRLWPDGRPWRWLFISSAVIEYTAGYVLPGMKGSTLPAGIEGACVELVQNFWFSCGADPAIKSVETPGVETIQYWVGGVGDPTLLPPSVIRKLAPFTRAAVG